MRALPRLLDGSGEGCRRVVAVAAGEVGVAEIAGEIAAGEAAEHRRAARLRALALQRLEDFLDGVAHAIATKNEGRLAAPLEQYAELELALRELEAATRAGAAVLLALDDA